MSSGGFGSQLILASIGGVGVAGGINYAVLRHLLKYWGDLRDWLTSGYSDLISIEALIPSLG